MEKRECFELIKNHLFSLPESQAKERERDIVRLRCPAHDDNNPSLDIIFRNGSIKFKCWAGCTENEIKKGLIEVYQIPQEWLSFNGYNGKNIIERKEEEEIDKIEDEGKDVKGVKLADFLPEPYLSFAKRYVLEKDNQIIFSLGDPNGKVWELRRVSLLGAKKNILQKGAPAKEILFIPFKENFQRIYICESPMDALLFTLIDFNGVGIAGIGKSNTPSALKAHREKLREILGEVSDMRVDVYVWQEPDASSFGKEVAEAIEYPIKIIEAPSPENKDMLRLILKYGMERVKDWLPELREKANFLEPFGVDKWKFYFERERKKLPEPFWEGLIYEGNLVIVSGRPRTGKTTFALNLAKATLEGKEFLRRQVKQGQVAFLCYEKIVIVEDKINSLGLENIIFLDGKEQGLYSNNLKALEYGIKRYDIKLLIIDPLMIFLSDQIKTSKDLNDYSKIYSVMEKLKKLSENTGVVILLLMHSRKEIEGEGTERSILGSTALAGAVDVTINLFREQETIKNGDGKKEKIQVNKMVIEGNLIREPVSLLYKITDDLEIEVANPDDLENEIRYDIDKALFVIEQFIIYKGKAEPKEMKGLLRQEFPEKSERAVTLLYHKAIDRLKIQGKIRKEGKIYTPSTPYQV